MRIGLVVLGAVLAACNGAVPYQMAPEPDFQVAISLDLAEERLNPDFLVPVPLCAPGTEDCDGEARNGCEAVIANDPDHCGNCATVCPGATSGVRGCLAGRCTFDCIRDRADCDQVPGNGCEVTLVTDLHNCGACGRACVQGPNATDVSCKSGGCVLACKPGYGDCNGLDKDGCERPLSDDLLHCGRCGRACAALNAIATCSQGVCTLQCVVGFVDCDMNPATGCEADLKVDAKNCGGCGLVCPQNRPKCVGGLCTL